MYEVEIKFALSDPVDFEQQLQEFGCKIEDAVEEFDLFFQHPSRNFVQTDECLRLRQRIFTNGNTESSLTYKGPKIDKETKTRKEIEIPLKQDTRCKELLTALGFAAVAQVYKQRRSGSLHFQEQSINVTIDYLPDLAIKQGKGTFVELETFADDATLDSKKHLLRTLARQLGLQHPIQESYLALLNAGSNPD